MSRQKITLPLAVGLVQLRHRLVADQVSSNLARIALIHAAASLPRSVPAAQQSGPDKQKTPPPARDEAFTNASTLAGVQRGCYTDSA